MDNEIKSNTNSNDFISKQNCSNSSSKLTTTNFETCVEQISDSKRRPDIIPYPPTTAGDGNECWKTFRSETDDTSKLADAKPRDDEPLDNQTSIVQDVFFRIHDVTKETALPSRCSTTATLRNVRDGMLQAILSTHNCGDVLDIMAQPAEGLVDHPKRFGFKSDAHLKSESCRIPCLVSNSDRRSGDDEVEKHLRSIASFVDSDRNTIVSERSKDLRYDSTCSVRPHGDRRLSDDHGPERKNDDDIETIHALVATEMLPNRTDHRTCSECSEDATTLPLLGTQLGRREVIGAANDTRHDHKHKRTTRTSQSQERWVAKDGTLGVSTRDDSSILTSFRQGDASSLSQLGNAFELNEIGDDGGRGFYDDPDDETISRMIHDNNETRRTSLFARRPTRVATREHSHLPLHIQSPPVPFLSWTIADDLMQSGSSYGDHRVWFTLTRLFREFEFAKSTFSSVLKSDHVAKEAALFNDDFDTVMKAQFIIDSGMTIEQFNEHHQGTIAFVRMFQVLETKETGDRRRIISWPRELNVTEKKIVEELKLLHHAKVMFDKASEVRDRGVKFAYAASLDFKKFFQQFELLVKQFWAVRFKSKVFLLSTIPTGAVSPPLFAQALSRTLLCIAVRVSSTQHLVQHDACIDNLRLCSNNLHALCAAWHELLRLCGHLGATIGELNPPPMTVQHSYKYLGMVFSSRSDVMQVCLAPKSIRKINEAVELLRSRSPMKVVDVISIFGHTVWASTVTCYSLGKLYYVIKFVRRIQRLDLDELTTVWPSIVDLWASALNEMTTMIHTAEQKHTHQTIMYTDASESGWGVVILDLYNRPFRIFAGPWSPAEAKHSINELELRALRIGLRTLASIKTSGDIVKVDCYIDNTTARAWAARRRAPTFSANNVAIDIDQELRCNGIQLSSLSYVESAKNIADAASRRHAFKATSSGTMANMGAGAATLDP